MSEAVLRLRGVSKRYGTRAALTRLDLALRRGEVMGLLGPNGSGKSTALRIAAGVIGCDAGRVERGETRGVALGYLPEGAPLYEALRVDDMVEFATRAKGLRGERARQARDAVIARCDLAGWRSHRVAQLSKGTRQRVGFAQALVGDPDLLLLDEPTSGLDPLQALAARALIHDGAEQRATLLCTHVLHEAAALCTRILILRDGAVVAEHRPGESEAAARAVELERVFVAALRENPAS